MSWRTGFLISLAVNILIVGALAGFVLGGGLTRVRNMSGMVLNEPRAVAAALPADVRVALRGDLVRAWFEAGEERAAWRAANAEVVRQLEAERYDVAAMQGALRRQRETGAAAMATFQNELAQSLAALTPEQRRAAAAALTRVRTRADEDAAPEDNTTQSGESETPRERLRERVLERLRERQQN